MGRGRKADPWSGRSKNRAWLVVEARKKRGLGPKGKCDQTTHAIRKRGKEDYRPLFPEKKKKKKGENKPRKKGGLTTPSREERDSQAIQQEKKEKKGGGHKNPWGRGRGPRPNISYLLPNRGENGHYYIRGRKKKKKRGGEREAGISEGGWN